MVANVRKCEGVPGLPSTFLNDLLVELSARFGKREFQYFLVIGVLY